MRRSRGRLYLVNRDTRPDSDYDPKELAAGTEIESKEHGVSRAAGKRIAKDHLDEFPRYYSYLIGMEERMQEDMDKEMAG